MVEKTINLYKEAMERSRRNSEAEPEDGPDPDDPDSVDFTQ
jgi:hypothetical protein